MRGVQRRPVFLETNRVCRENGAFVGLGGLFMEQSHASLKGWASRWVFILAATGSAVGLGNIWKFPYITGQYGGGAFVLMYLLIILLVGIPVMVAEVMMGRRGGQSPINTMKKLAGQAEVSSRWKWLGYLGALAGFLILTFYSVIAGWALYYIVAMPTQLAGADAAAVSATFDGLLASPLIMLGCHSLFMLLTAAVVLQGVHRGLQRAAEIMMPALFVMLLVLLGYAASSGGFDQALAFMFSVDFSKLSADAVLVAMGHSFFTLSLGLGAIMAYGAYMPREATNRHGQKKPVSIGSTVLTIAFLDTLVALVAGLCIFRWCLPMASSRRPAPACCSRHCRWRLCRCRGDLVRHSVLRAGTVCSLELVDLATGATGGLVCRVRLDPGESDDGSGAGGLADRYRLGVVV